MIKAILIDDEENAIRVLHADLTKYCPGVEVIATASSGKEGLLLIKKHAPQLVFLDVDMPWMNGFEMLELVDKINFQLIFVTAYDQYAVKAFRMSAVDYLLKPFGSVELIEAVGKVEGILAKLPAENLPVNNLLNNINLPELHQKIALPYREGYEFFEPEIILFCEAEGAYTRLHFINSARVLLVSKSLGDIEELLPAVLFLRIHHSTIVNTNCITHFIKTDGGYVQLNNGKRLMVSKSRKDALLLKLGLK